MEYTSISILQRGAIAMGRRAKFSVVVVATIAMVAVLISAGFTQWPKEQPMPSSANPPPPPNVSAQDTPRAGSRTEPPASTTLRYWTPERLRDAIPMDVGTNDQDTLSDDDSPATPDEPEISLPGQPPADER